MTKRDISTILPGLLCAGLIGSFILVALSSLWLAAPAQSVATLWRDPYLQHITQFSFTQALLSTALSLGLALPLANALFHRQFTGRATLLRLFSLTLVLPVLVAVFGLLSLYGKSGLLNQWFGTALSIYGLKGILLAHVFFNAPLATRLLLHALEAIPSQQLLLADQLGFTRRQRLKLIYWPRMRQQLPHAGGLVFMLCFTSFATVMALGGGPKATTIELAIYQAIRFDFDLGYGAVLAMWQMLLCGSLVMLIQRFAKPVAIEPAMQPQRRRYCDSLAQRCRDGVWISLGAGLVVPPLIAVVVAGINQQTFNVLQQPALWQAAFNSLRIAFCASLLAMLAGLCILAASRHWRLKSQAMRANTIELVGSLILVTPGLVISTGLFLLVRQFGNVFAHTFWLVVIVNALMALPFVLKTLSQPLLQCAQQYQSLCQSLGMQGWQRWRWVEWRIVRAPMVQALGLAFVMSLGDLTAIALFGSQQFQTLPLYLFQLMGSYQMEAAATVALVLFAISFGLFSFMERHLVTR